MKDRLVRAAFVSLCIILSFAFAAPVFASEPTIEHDQIEER
jgi:hypothetical protein